MCEFDKSLQEIDDKRITFTKEFNNLESKHNKLYKKLMPVFNEINEWMIGAENYMNKLKQSIDKNKNDIYEIQNKPIYPTWHQESK